MSSARQRTYEKCLQVGRHGNCLPPSSSAGHARSTLGGRSAWAGEWAFSWCFFRAACLFRFVLRCVLFHRSIQFIHDFLPPNQRLIVVEWSIRCTETIFFCFWKTMKSPAHVSVAWQHTTVASWRRCLETWQRSPNLFDLLWTRCRCEGSKSWKLSRIPGRRTELCVICSPLLETWHLSTSKKWPLTFFVITGGRFRSVDWNSLPCIIRLTPFLACAFHAWMQMLSNLLAGLKCV